MDWYDYFADKASYEFYTAKRRKGGGMMKAGFVIVVEGFSKSTGCAAEELFMMNAYRLVYAKKSLVLDAIRRLAAQNPGTRYYAAELRYAMIVPVVPEVEECALVDGDAVRG